LNGKGRRRVRTGLAVTLLNEQPALLLNEDHAGHAGVCDAKKEIDEQAAFGVGMKEKAKEFVAAGGDIYAKA